MASEWKIGTLPSTTAETGKATPQRPPGSGTLSRQQLEDLQQGLAEWRSIQDVVQLTFQAFFDALKTQGDAIKGLEKSRDQFTTSLRTEIDAALRAKASGPDLSGKMTQIESQLARKADISDVERRPVRGEVEASLRTQMADTVAMLKAQQEQSASKAWQESCERQLAALRSDVARIGTSLEELRHVLAHKANAQDVTHQLSLKADTDDVDMRLRDKASRKLLGECLSSKADIATVEQRVSELRHRITDLDDTLNRKTDQTKLEVTRVTDKLASRHEADMSAATAALEGLSARFDDTLAAQSKAIAAVESEATHLITTTRDDLLSRVRELGERHNAALARKAETSEVARLISETRGEVSGLRDALNTRAPLSSVTALEGQVAALSLIPARVDALVREETQLVATTRKLSSAVEAKANVADVNKALAEVCADLSSRAPVEQLDSVVSRVEQVANSVMSHNMTARWLWKSGRLLPAAQIPWEVEALNIAPSLFMWRAGEATVVSVLPGLYQLSYGFFTSARPIVQFLVNGEPVFTTAGHGTASGAVRHLPTGTYSGGGDGSSSGQQAPHSAGNVLGLTGSEFISLPGNARLSMLFQGETQGVEGFLMLHKLHVQ